LNKYTQTKVKRDHPQERIGELKMLDKFWDMVINNIIDKKITNVKYYFFGLEEKTG
jgi:hypothetical protein